MLDRLMATLLLWGLEACLAWFVMHEYTGAVAARLDDISRALGGT